MLSKDKLIEIIRTWDHEVRNTRLFDREIYPDLRKHFMSPVPMVLHGIRRSGKTFMMYKLMQEFKGAVYINFEDERFSGAGSEILQEIYEVYVGNYTFERPVLFLDEVQVISGWEKFVARLMSKVKFVISGSNASLMSSEYSTALTGRHIPIRMFPLSFSEFLAARNFKIMDPGITESRARLDAMFSEYIQFGGFPNASLQRDKDLLRSTFDSIIYRDVIPRFSIQNPTGMESLARYLVSNPGKLFSYRSLAPVANLRHEDTVKTYIDYLERAYLFILLTRFDYSLRKQAANQKKIFPADTSFTNFCGSLFSEERGRLLETVVCNELKRKNHDIFYWKDARGREVDFLVCQGLKPVSLIQVCERIQTEKSFKRETGNLLLAAEELNVSELFLLTEVPVNFPVPDEIKCMSLAEWMQKDRMS